MSEICKKACNRQKYTVVRKHVPEQAQSEHWRARYRSGWPPGWSAWAALASVLSFPCLRLTCHASDTLSKVAIVTEQALEGKGSVFGARCPSY